MFTGLVTHTARLQSFERPVLRVGFEGHAFDAEPLKLGESIAVNGCCLTVVRWDSDWAEFELSDETLQKTTFGTLEVGCTLNLERALRLGDRMGGHWVQGHVDGVGRCHSIEPSEAGTAFRFELPRQGAPILIPKGSITIDGISLTLVDISPTTVSCWIIPHTLEATHLRMMKPGDAVNIEFDVLSKFFHQWVESKDWTQLPINS